MSKLDRKHCVGCEDDFYNGNNDLGVDECWCREDAKQKQYLMIPADMLPPYKHMKTEWKPTCFHRKGYVKVKKASLTSDGYWRL